MSSNKKIMKHKKLILSLIIIASLTGLLTFTLLQPQQTPPFLPTATQTGGMQATQILKTPTIQNLTSEDLTIEPSALENSIFAFAQSQFNESFFNLSIPSGVTNIIQFSSVLMVHIAEQGLNSSAPHNILPISGFYPVSAIWNNTLGAINVLVNGTDTSAVQNCNSAMDQLFNQLQQKLSTTLGISIQKIEKHTQVITTTFGPYEEYTEITQGFLTFNSLNTSAETYNVLEGLIPDDTFAKTIVQKDSLSKSIMVADGGFNYTGTLLKSASMTAGAIIEGQIGKSGDSYTLSLRNLLQPAGNITSQAQAYVIINLPVTSNINSFYPSTAFTHSYLMRPSLYFSTYEYPFSVEDVNVTYTLEREVPYVIAEYDMTNWNMNPGDTANLTVTLKNMGTTTAYNVTPLQYIQNTTVMYFTDTMSSNPPFTNSFTLAPGESNVTNYRVTANNTGSTKIFVQHQFRRAPEGITNFGLSGDLYAHVGVSEPIIMYSIDCSDWVVRPGDPVSVIFTVRNLGTQTANNVTVPFIPHMGPIIDSNITLPEMYQSIFYSEPWVLGDIPAGQAITANVTSEVDYHSFHTGGLAYSQVMAPVAGFIPFLSLTLPSLRPITSAHLEYEKYPELVNFGIDDEVSVSVKVNNLGMETETVTIKDIIPSEYFELYDGTNTLTINIDSNSSATLTYTLKAIKAGTIRLPPPLILVNNSIAYSARKTIVAPNQPPIVDNIIIKSTYGTKVWFSCQVYDSEGDSIIAYEWDFGDGTQSTDPNPYHEYTDEGTYTISLRVQDSHGDWGAYKYLTINVSKTIWINPTIIDVNVFTNLNITINGDLTITETGELYLINCILNVNNGTTPVQYGIRVYGGVYINESSTITAINPANPYYFTVYEDATLQMKNSRVEYCGHSSGSSPNQQGLTIRTDNAWIENNTITNSYNGLILYQSERSTILNNNATNNTQSGFYLYSSSDSTYSGNTATGNGYGFYLFYSSYNTLSGNNASNNVNAGFYLYGSNNNLISNNYAINNTRGFYLYYSSSNTLSGNNATNNNQSGFYLQSSSNNIISGNTAIANSAWGFYLYSSSNKNTLTGNTAVKNQIGFILNSSSNNDLTDNTATQNNYGFYLSNSSNSIINNIATNNTQSGFYLYSSSDSTYSGNTATGNGYGFYLSSGSYNTLSGNTASSNGYGFYLYYSSSITLSGNTATGNGYGFYLLNSSYNTLSGNNASNNVNTGFYLLENSNNNLISNNYAANNTRGFYLKNSSYNTLSGNNASNNVNTGFYLLENSNNNLISNNIAINNNQSGFCMDYRSNNNLLSGNTATNNMHGFYLDSSSNNNFTSNIATNNKEHGFYMIHGWDNTFSHNTAINNTHAFYLSSSSHNILSDNIATGNNQSGFCLFRSSNNFLSGNNAAKNGHSGFCLDSDSNNNNITGNTATYNQYGYFVYQSSNNLLSGNNATDNNQSGFYLWFGSNNLVSGNKAENNHMHGFYLYSSSNNTIQANRATNNTQSGFYLDESFYNTLNWNSATNNNSYGFYLDESFYNTLSRNSATNNNSYGFYLYTSSNNTLSGNTASNNCRGFLLNSSSYNLLSGNIATNNFNGSGFYLNESFYNTLSGNSAINNYEYEYGYGDPSFLLNSSSYNILSDNIATNNTVGGFLLWNSSNNTLSDNSAINNTGFGTFGFFMLYSDDNILLGNVATNNDWRGFALTYCDGNLLSGNIATNNDYGGFGMHDSNNNTLTGNTATNNNDWGFYLHYILDNNLSGNIATNNIHGYYLYVSQRNILSGNTAANNIQSGFYLDVYCLNTNLTGNVATNNQVGFYLYRMGYNNNLSGNIAINNTDYGFYLESSSDILLSGNTAANNSYGFYLRSSSSNNLTGNIAVNNSNYGFHILFGSNNLLSGNNATNNNNYGFFLNSSSKNILSSNVATNNLNTGFYLEKSSNNLLSINIAINNNNYGFYLNSSLNNSLTGNTATNNFNGFYLLGSDNNTLIYNNATHNTNYGYRLQNSSSNIITGNTALNCTTGYYWTDSSNNDFTGSVEENWLRVNVMNVLGLPFPSVDVRVETDGISVYATPWFGGLDSVTDPTGFIPWITVIHKTGTGIDTMTENITTVTVRYSTPWTVVSFSNNPRIVDMSTSHIETFRQQYVNVAWINPVITDVNVLQYFNITINGDLTITETGELHLINCILNLNNGTTPVEYGVKVYGGMYINESSTITAINPVNPYYFTVYEGASFQMNNSRVEYCGHENGLWPDQQGLIVRADNAWIENNTITQCWNGLILYGSNGSIILNNNATDNTENGFALFNFADNNLLSGNMAANNAQYGFYLNRSYYNTLSGNMAANNAQYGFYLNYSSYNGLSGNIAINNTCGFYLWFAFENLLSGNIAINNAEQGFYLRYVGGDNTFTNNTATNNHIGFSVDYTNNNTFTNNIANNNTYGFFITLHSDANKLYNNTALNNHNGFYLEGGSNNIFTNNTAANNTRGFYFNNTESNTLTNNVAANNTYGFFLNYSEANNLTGNTALNNQYGFYLLESSNKNIISGNFATNNYHGFYLNASSYNTLVSNTATNNGDQGFVLISNSNNNLLSGNTATNNGYGFSLYSSSYNNLTSNTATNNYYGFYLVDGSNNNLLSGNTATNSTYYGFYLRNNANNNLLLNNTATYNIRGFYLYESSNNNNLSGNTATNNGDGFYLYLSSFNNLAGNIAVNNEYGFYLYSGSNNNLLSDNIATENIYGFKLHKTSYNTIVNNTALNCTTGYYWTDSSNNDFTGSVEENWLRVNVIYVLDVPLPGVDVQVVTDGTPVYATPWFGGSDPVTDQNGLIPWITVTYKTGTGIDSITKNITTVTVRYPTQWTEATFPNNPRIVDMSTSHLETFRQQYVNVTWINPVITEVNVLQYFNITIKGNLTIESGGELHLINCILNLNNGTTPVEYGVKVYGGMYINESSTISPINPANPYFFTVYEGASFQMNDSRVEYCGDGSGSFPDEWGLAVRTDNAWIKNNTLTHGRSGLILYGSQGSTILNNNITNNTGAYGLWLHNSWYNNLTGNTATNHWLGIRLINSSYNTLTGNTATNNTYGFILEDNPNNNNLVGNTATGNTYGFYLYYNSNNNKITDNTAINNIYGFMLLSGSNNNTLKDNIAINCSTGYNWSSNSINNDFTGSVWLNYLRLNITDSLGLPIPGVDVMVETDGVQVYATPHFAGSDPRTDQNGLTSWIVVPYKIFTGNDTMTENTVTVTVWNSTAFFLNNSRTVSMSMSHVEIFILDNLPPTVTITSPDNGAFIPTTDVEVTWTGYDLSGIDHYEVRLDSGNWINVGISTSHTFTNLSKDFHTVYVRAFDKAGYNTLDSVSFAVGPDFAIFTENISLEKIGGITYIYATVTNLGGDYMGPIEVIFLDKDEYGNIIIGVQIIENLLHDESKTVSVEWKLNQFHTVIVMVDPDSGIEELNETNNVAQKYIYDYRPIIQNVSSEFGVWEDSDSVGTFITEIEVINTFRVLVSDRDGADDIVRVVFKLNGKTYDATRHGSSWKCELDMGDLNPTVEPIKQNILEITAYDKAGLISDTRIVTIRAIDASPWASFFSSLDYTTEWDSINQKYLLKGTIPIFGELKLDYSVKIPKEIPKVGNKPVGVYLELSAEIVYYVNGSAKASQITGMGVNWLGSEYGRKMEVTYLDLNDDLSFDYYILKDTHKFPIPYSWKIPDGYLYLPDPFLGGTFSPEFGLYLDGEISYEIRFEMIDTEINIISLSVDLGFHGGGKLRQRWPILLVVWPAIMEIDAYAYTNMHAVFTFTDYGNYYSFYGDPGIGVYCDCRLWIWTIQGWEDYGIIRTPEIELPFLLGTLGTSSLGQVNPLMAEEPRSVALENAISVDSSPRVAADAYGNAMVIWVQGRVDGNNTYSDICYATWNGTDWSTSGFISYDEHCDFDPALTYDSNGNVIAVWSRILYDPPLYSPDDPLSLFKNQEIVYSLWDGSTWSIPQPITNDTFSDGTAAVTAGPDGTVIAVWVGYTEADFSTPIDTNLYYSVWDGAQWTPKTPLTNNTFMDYSVSLAHDSKGNAIACWVRDLDGNISTSFDTELRYAMWDGTSWSPSGLITGLNETIESPSVTFDLNDNALVTWVGGDEIANRLYFASWDKTTGSWSEPEIVHEADFFIYNPVINVDPDNTAMIIWRGFDDEAEEPTYYVNNIISTYFDGEICYAAKNLSRPDSSWSEIKFLTSDNETDWMASAVTIPGHSYDLLLVWDKEGIMSNLTHPIKPDLILDSSDITFSNNYPSAGETIDITARISNIGDVEAYNISVEFYDGDPSDGGDFIGTQLIDYLNYNSEVYVTLTWVAEAGAHNIYVVIDPLGSISELDETNNIAYNTICTLPDLFVYPTDIAFSNSNPLVGEQITIYATINNQGGTYAENVLVQFYANDIQIGSQTISSIDANGYAKVSMDWTATAGYNKITIVVDSINLIVEWNEENNIASTSISILPDLEVNETSLSDKELMPGENVSIATEIRNLGSADAIGVLVEFFDGNPYINGTLIYSETIDLTIGGTHTSAFVWTPPLGIHQVFVMVDRQNLIAESNETNNIQYDELVVRIVPDLTILESEITYESGSIKIIVPVENIGEAGATGVVVGLYDGDPATGGAMLDGETILHIPAGGTANFSLILYETPKSGFLYIVVDPGNMIMESNETNNKVAISYETIILVDAGPDQVVDEGDLVEFSAWVLLPGDIADYTFTWDFGDGTTGEGVNTTHRYGDNGEYTVTITVYSDGVIGTDQMKVTVQNVAPTVDAGPDQTVDEGTPLNFNANLTDPGFLDTHTISWTFGDGSTTTGTLTPTHTYVDNGIYTVILTVTDDDGETSTDTLKVIVNNVAPTVDVGLDQTVNEDETVSFSPIVTDPGSDTFAYSWDFDGDGVTDSTLENPTHVYTKTGTYTVTLTVTDDDGGVGMDSLTVRVLNVPPVADAGPDQAVDENQEIIFNASNSWDTPSDLPTLTYNWNFGDGNMGTGLVVSHMYEDSGTYTVTLTVTDDDGAVGTDTCVVTVLDKTPPTTELIIGPHYVDQAGNIYVTSTTDFTLIASDAFSGVACTYYRINDGEWIEYVSPFNITGPIGNYTIEYYSVDNAGNEETPKSETIILEEAYHGHGMLRIDKQWFRGDATLFLSENLIRIQIDDQIATWNIVKHCQKGNIDIYFGEGELGKIVLIIHRGEISTHVLAAGRGVFFCGHT